jgi:hypothetical protein
MAMVVETVETGNWWKLNYGTAEIHFNTTLPEFGDGSAIKPSSLTLGSIPRHQ